ncbi:hypothetical protein MPSYJ_19500 [Mycolicibacterium psychrotolerans]|uniref:Uncharacterized protein n=1 Tax=Mycolicibacterium psychrotolerans TaxID=216929 RepID=A0A7I7MAW6_9MYCO|nr:hypothetical protein MPSYJ_19500 [Mycolicibacterium psychrotolerans]
MEGDTGPEVGPAEDIIRTPERHVGGAMHDGINAAHCRRPVRWGITVDQFRQVTENWLGPGPTDEFGGAVRAGERTHVVTRADQPPDQVLPDESTATRDENLHLLLDSFYAKSFDVKLYLH